MEINLGEWRLNAAPFESAMPRCSVLMLTVFEDSGEFFRAPSLPVATGYF